MMPNPAFWQNVDQAQKLVEESNGLRNDLDEWRKVSGEIETLRGAEEEVIVQRWPALEKSVAGFKTRTLLGGKYDNAPALLEVFSGAGGVDAQDWAAMLLRMYQRYAEKQGFAFKILNQSWGEQKGLKSATAEIRGRYAYGYLKKEAGVHRLVRISPFSAKNLRHTSFALVEVLPWLEGRTDLKINAQDLRIDTFRSSGPGGQNVNKLETAVRITHLPTGLSVAAQSERSQSQNKEKALAILYSRLLKLMEEKQVEAVGKLKALAEPGGIEWGNQIRSYVLHPYKMVKDHRTEKESSSPEKVLDGALEEFIEAELSQI